MSKHFETVSVHDPAIDHDATTPKALREFAETRDLSKLVFLKNMQPAKYLLGEIEHSLMDSWIMGASTEHQQAKRAFQCSVQSVMNYAQQESGVRVNWEEPPRDKVGAITDEALARFPPVLLAEIGGVAFRRSFFGPTIKHGYVLPPLSAALLVEQIGRRADANQS